MIRGLLLFLCSLVMLFNTAFVCVANKESADMPWNRLRHDLLTRRSEHLLDTLYSFPALEYPINNVDTLFELFGQSTITIFSYGSLLNKESASRTLRTETMDTYQPAVAFGVRRVFDRNVPNTSRWGIPIRPNDTAMLNLHETDHMSDIVYGIIIEVDSNELKALVDREEGYDLIPVVAMLWDDALDTANQEPEPFIAYTFHAADAPRRNIFYTNSHINPVPGYAQAAKAGAAQYGNAFLKLWVATTFLADQKTPFAEWEKNPLIDCGYPLK